MGNYQDSGLKTEYNLNVVRLNKRFTKAKIRCIFDAQSGKIVKLSQAQLDALLLDPDLYYHGTSECSAFSIVCDGLQPPKEYAHRGHYLGNGLFVADNINHSLAYGSCVFLCYVRFKKTLEMTFETDRDTMFNMIDTDFVRYETVKCIGRFGRNGKRNFKEDGSEIFVHPSFERYYTPNYNEYRIKTASNIVPRYLIKFDKTVGIRDEKQIIRAVLTFKIKYQTFCIYDNREYQKYYDGLEHEAAKFAELNALIKTRDYFYVPMFFCEALEFLRSMYMVDVYTLQNHLIKKRVHDYTNVDTLLEYFKHGLALYKDIDVLPNKYLAACHLRDVDNNLITAITETDLLVEKMLNGVRAHVLRTTNAPKISIICDYILIRSDNQSIYERKFK